MAKPAQVHASNAEQQELTTLQLKEADVLTVHYMFPGAYRNTAH